VALEYVDEVYDDGAAIPVPEVTSDLAGVYSLRATENFDIVSGAIKPRVDLTWRGIAMTWGIQYRADGSTSWTDLGAITVPYYSVDGTLLNPNTDYEFQVTSANTQSSTSITYYGGPAPDDLTGVYSLLQNGSLYLACDQISTPWETTYEVRKGTSWDTAQLVGTSSTPLIQIGGAGSYLMAAKSGVRYSETPTAITVTDSPTIANVIAIYDERATGWAGAKESVTIVGDELWCLSPGDAYAITDVYFVGDVWTYGAVSTTGVYTIPDSHIVSVGTESVCNIYIDYTQRGESLTDDIYDHLDIYAVVDVYGGVSQYVSAYVEISTYRSGEWGPWVAYSQGQYTGEKFKARIILASLSQDVICILEQFTFSVDVPDRIDRHKGITVPVTGLNFTHSPVFNVVPSTVVQIISATQGDDAILTLETISGGNLVITNGGSAVERTVNLLHVGY